jgi:LmbE family N-acetylglucosaminyl deacetylase
MRVLSVAAHSDDNQIGCGGILSQLVDRGDEVKALFTSGYEKESIPSSLQVLGIKDFEVLGLEFEKQYKQTDILTKRVEEIFDAFRPEIVFTHWPESDLMVDHSVTGRVVRDISLAYGLGWQGRIYFFEINQCCQGFRSDIYVQVDKEHWKRKIDSIEALSTYAPRVRELMISAAEVKGRIRGLECGAEYAECFARFSPRSISITNL